jgi:uncharacterized phage protein gp47/JayE
MPFTRPSPQQIRDRLAAELQVAIPGADARLRRSMEEVLVRAIAVASHELHGHLAWAARQILVDTAEAEQLDRHAGIWGITRRAAAPARGPVTVTGTTGAVLPAGAEMRRSDDTRFLLDADVTIGGGGTGTGAVTAVVAAASGNTAAATTLSLVSPIGGIGANLVVASGGLAAGADIEADAALRARILQRIQRPPQGGAAADYVAWAQTVPGVGRAWCYPLHLGAGTVGVAFLTSAGGIPGAPLVAQVQAAINVLRPVTADVTVFAPAPVTVDVQVTLSPDTSAVRLAVQNSLVAFFTAEAEPGLTLRRSRISAAVSAAAGETWHALVAPAADVTLGAGEVAVLGTVSFT